MNHNLTAQEYADLITNTTDKVTCKDCAWNGYTALVVGDEHYLLASRYDSVEYGNAGACKPQ